MTLSAENNAQASAAALRWLTLIDLQFAAGTLHITDLDRDIAADGFVYTPAMVLQGIDGMQDNIDGKPRRISVKLSGLDAVLRARALATRIAFGEAVVRIAFCDASWTILNTPLVVARAVLSNAEAQYDAETGSITISAETRAILLSRNALQLGSDQGQQQRFPGDTALARVAMVAGYQINWGGGSAVTLPTNRRGSETGRTRGNLSRANN